MLYMILVGCCVVDYTIIVINTYSPPRVVD